MSRARCRQPPVDGLVLRAAAEPASNDSAADAENIGMIALYLAKRANAAGLTKLGFLLETVALEAGAEAVARRWPADVSES